MEQTPCTVRFLDDSPTAEDAFGSHNRTADAIADLILCEQGGKAIALSGSFGSGKSTVVRLLEKRIDARSGAAVRVSVFIYDAWAHQGDPLRRSFLESLRQHLISAKWLEKNALGDEFEGLSQRRQKTDTEGKSMTTPALTRWGRLMAVALILVPAGVGLIERVDKRRPWTFIVGLALTALPIALAAVVAAGTWLWRKPTFRLWRKDFWTRDRGTHEKDSLAGLFLQRTRERTDVEQHSASMTTPEPTSIEFGGLFRKLLDEALKDDRRLAVVIDNLDRLDPPEALHAWSTMRVFFEPGGSQPGWANRLWLIVPFDPRAIGRLWSDASEELKGATNASNAGQPASQRTVASLSGSGLAEAAIAKTFQISFSVSQPVLSDWQSFFQAQIAQALPSHNPEEFANIRLIYSHLRTPQDAPVTPRETKLFINKLCALHKQRGDEIPLTSQAAYLLCADRITEPSKDLVKKNFFDLRVQPLVEAPNWRLHLAALHFNVETDKAAQVLIGEEVRRALEEGDKDALEKLSNFPGFEEVCEDVVHSDHYVWAAQQPQVIGLAASALDGVNSYPATWSYLREAVRWVAKLPAPARRWWPLDERIADGLCVILRHSSNDQPELARALLRGLSASEPETQQPKQPSVVSQPIAKEVEDWVGGASKILEEVKRLVGEEPVSEEFRVPGSPQTYLAILEAARTKATPEELLKHFVPACLLDQVTNEIARRIAQDAPDQTRAETIEAMTAIPATWPWKPVVDDLVNRLKDQQAPREREVAHWLDLLFALALSANPDQQAVDWLRGQATETSGEAEVDLIRHLYRFQPSQLVAPRCLFALVLFDPPRLQHPVEPTTPWVNDQPVRQLLEGPAQVAGPLSMLVVKWRKLAELLDAAAKYPQLKALVQEVARQVAKSRQIAEQLDGSSFIKHYAFLSETFGPDVTREVVQEFAARESFLKNLSQMPFSPGLAALYRQVIEARSTPYGNELRPLAEAVTTGLRTVEKGVWQRELAVYGPLLQLAVTLANSQKGADLGPAYQDALLERAKTLLGGQKAAAGLSWGLVGGLPQEKRSLFWRDLRDLLLGSEQKPLQEFLKLYREPLSMDGGFGDKADETIRHLFRPIVERANSDELSWMERLLSNDQTIAANAQDDAKADLLGRLENLRDNEQQPNEVRLCAGRIAELLQAKAY